MPFDLPTITTIGGYTFHSPDTFYAGRMLDRFNSPDLAMRAAEFNPRVVVDAGAHIGETTFYLALAWPGAEFYCIEPHPDSFKYLVLNTRGLPNRVNYFEGAAADKAGSLSLALPDPYQRDGKFDPSNPTGLLSAYGRGRDRLDVAARPLDEIVPEGVRVDFLKVDVEGYELEVLTGAHRILHRDRPAVAVEIMESLQGHAGRRPEVMFEFMRQAGYFLHSYLFGADILFEHKSKRNGNQTQAAVHGHQAAGKARLGQPVRPQVRA